MKKYNYSNGWFPYDATIATKKVERMLFPYRLVSIRIAVIVTITKKWFPHNRNDC